MTEFEIIEKLKKYTDAGEVYRVRKFRCYRTAKDGTHQEVEIEVWDRGPSDPASRYHVTATANDGRAATGSSGPDLETVLAMVHWFDLDK